LRLLCDDAWAPITSGIGFAQIALAAAARYFEQRITPGTTQRGGRVAVRPLDGSLPACLSELLPLTVGESSKVLVMATDSDWVAYFENKRIGADVATRMATLATDCSTRGVRAVAVPDSYRRTPQGRTGRYGASIFELYGPELTERLNTVRSVSAMHDGSRWMFNVEGERQPFEQAEHYTRRRIKDRFTFEMLRDYLGALGIRAFDEDFYGPQAVMLEKVGITPRPVEISLEDVQSSYTSYR
jgi:hypothetical protein